MSTPATITLSDLRLLAELAIAGADSAADAFGEDADATTQADVLAIALGVLTDAHRDYPADTPVTITVGRRVDTVRADELVAGLHIRVGGSLVGIESTDAADGWGDLWVQQPDGSVTSITFPADALVEVES